MDALVDSLVHHQAVLEPPTTIETKPPPPQGRGWGKGTVDYSKWDAISDDDD